MTVKDKDRGWRRMLAIALEANPLVVTVGVQGDAERATGEISNIDLATIHEFGAPGAGIPERSFIRSTLEDQQGYRELARKLTDAVVAGKVDVPKALALFGEQVSSDIKRKIESGIDPPNAPATVAKKGSSKPLVDTGQLKNSISYVVKKDAG